MANEPILHGFASEIGVNPPVGGAQTVQDALEALAGDVVGGITTFAFTHDTAGLPAGLKVATLPQGAVVVNLILTIPTAFNGTTPHVNLGHTQAGAIAGNGDLAVFATTADTAVVGNFKTPARAMTITSPKLLVVDGGPGEIWIALTDGAGGAAASTVGAGALYVVTL